MPAVSSTAGYVGAVLHLVVGRDLAQARRSPRAWRSIRTRARSAVRSGSARSAACPSSARAPRPRRRAPGAGRCAPPTGMPPAPPPWIARRRGAGEAVARDEFRDRDEVEDRVHLGRPSARRDATPRRTRRRRARARSRGCRRARARRGAAGSNAGITEIAVAAVADEQRRIVGSAAWWSSCRPASPGSWCRRGRARRGAPRPSRRSPPPAAAAASCCAGPRYFASTSTTTGGSIQPCEAQHRAGASRVGLHLRDVRVERRLHVLGLLQARGARSGTRSRRSTPPTMPRRYSASFASAMDWITASPSGTTTFALRDIGTCRAHAQHAVARRALVREQQQLVAERLDRGHVVGDIDDLAPARLARGELALLGRVHRDLAAHAVARDGVGVARIERHHAATDTRTSGTSRAPPTPEAKTISSCAVSRPSTCRYTRMLA